MGRAYPIERKIYHKWGFLVQIKIGKKWIDWQGVAGSEQVVLEMGGNPIGWKKAGVGLVINPPEPKYTGYKG